MPFIKCRYCGEVFVSNDGRLQYCSDECRKKFVTDYNRNYKRKQRANDADLRERERVQNLKHYHDKVAAGWKPISHYVPKGKRK